MSQTFNINTYRAASLICHELGTPLAEIQAFTKWRTRKPRMVTLRSRVALRLRRLGHSYPNIGAVLGLDHSTVILIQKRAARDGF